MPPPLWFLIADTKRKVEQISEELKNLDEILAKDDNADGGTSDKTAAEDTAVPSVAQEDPDKGINCGIMGRGGRFRQT